MSDPEFRGVQHMVASSRDVGQRIDNCLQRHLKGVPKSRLYRMLRKGEVRVNKKRVDALYKIQEGDVIRIPPCHVDAESTPDIGILAFMSQQLEKVILQETKDWIAFNKPSGMAVHGGSGIAVGIIEALKAHWPHATDWELVHRLDRDTSGCLLVAKKPSVLKALQADWREGQIQKSYDALLCGSFGRGRRVNAPLVKTLRGQERFVQVSESGKPSITDFEVVQRFNEATWVKAILHTGRTHQIRVHAAHIDHPILGDEKYGSKLSHSLTEEIGLKRLFLHAERLSFTVGAQRITLNAPWDTALQSVIQKLG